MVRNMETDTDKCSFFEIKKSPACFKQQTGFPFANLVRRMPKSIFF